ncbi:NAD(+)/NADH kinase [Candidatus Woesearchaeota archaeon]|nr:NAD(+)/NADH kinase [Candidatus Woesearchaeota archaeon]
MQNHNQPINLSEILVGLKRSKVEWDMRKYRIDDLNKLIEQYKQEGIPLHDNNKISIDIIIQSHERQKEFREELIKSGVKKDNIIWAEDITSQLARKRKAVMSAGGDWAVDIVSHKLDNSTLFIPANSDYKASVGANTYYNLTNIREALRKIKSGEYYIEEWIRLEVQRNRIKVQSATSAVFIGERIRDDMSKQLVEFKGIIEKTTCSGMIIATPPGSTGWYDSVYYDRHKKSGAVPKTEQYAKFILTEPYPPGHDYKLKEGELRKGEEMIFTSLNDNVGQISIDSIRHYRFNRGTVARVRIADANLKVIRI